MIASKTLSIGYNPVGASAVVSKLKQFCEANALDSEFNFQMCVVTAEAVNNIIQHSPKSANDGFIKVKFDYCADHLTISLVYWCPEFTPPENAHCPDTDSLSGRGWHIIQSYMDNVLYHHNVGMNTLVLTKNTSIHHDA